MTQEEELCVTSPKRHKYSSDKREITPPAPDLVKQDFHAYTPNKTWLTDITKMTITARKIYVSVIVDSYNDLMPVKLEAGQMLH